MSIRIMFHLLYLLSMQAAFAIKPMSPLEPTVFDKRGIPPFTHERFLSPESFKIDYAA